MIKNYTYSDLLNDVLSNLHSGQWFGWRTHDDNGNKIPNNERMTYENIIVHDSSITLPTKEEINNTINELKIKYNYSCTRRLEYGSLESQLDEIYHNGIDAWKTRIASIKQKYPK